MNPGNGQRTVVVRAAGEIFPPGFRKAWDNAVFVAELVVTTWSQMTQDTLEKQVKLFITAAVDLKIFKQEQELLEMVNIQATVYRPERVRQGMGDILLLEIVHHGIDVLPQFLDLPMLFLVDVIDQDMHLTAVLREIAGDFLADKGIGQVGDFQTTVDIVVIGDGNPIHATLFGDGIELFGFGVTFMTAELLQHPLGRAGGKLGVDMEIDFHGQARGA